MAIGLIAVAAVVDLGIAVLAIAVSGFIVGSGPESLRAGAGGVVVLAAIVLACLLAPVAGFAMHRYGRSVGGIIVAWLPPIAGLFAVMIPPNY